MLTYDQARQYGKTYVGALNTGPDAFAALFAPGALVTLDGRAADLDAVLDRTPPGRCNYKGARLDGDLAVLRVRVRLGEDVTDHEHRVGLDELGRIAELRA